MAFHGVVIVYNQWQTFFIYCMKGVIVSIILKIGILKQKYSIILNKISLKQQTYIKNT